MGVGSMEWCEEIDEVGMGMCDMREVIGGSL